MTHVGVLMEVMESSVSQSACSGRGYAAPPLTWQRASPVVALILSCMSVGVILIDIGVYRSCSLRVFLLWVFCRYISSLPATRPAEKVLRLLFYLFGWAWIHCGRIIRRLQLIFSPRFSSGKKSSPQWQPCLTLIEWRALLCDSLWPLKRQACPFGSDSSRYIAAAEHPSMRKHKQHCSPHRRRESSGSWVQVYPFSLESQQAHLCTVRVVWSMNNSLLLFQ